MSTVWSQALALETARNVNSESQEISYEDMDSTLKHIRFLQSMYTDQIIFSL
jgi:hypothetical protein